MEVKWDGWCLKTEGTSVVTNSPGTPPLPALGLCNGFSPRGQGSGLLQYPLLICSIWPRARSLDANCFELYSCVSWLCLCPLKKPLHFNEKKEPGERKFLCFCRGNIRLRILEIVFCSSFLEATHLPTYPKTCAWIHVNPLAFRRACVSPGLVCGGEGCLVRAGPSLYTQHYPPACVRSYMSK